MFRAHLVLQHGEQIPNDAQPLRQQPDPLVHFEIAPHGRVHRFQTRFRPHELRAVEHGPLQMDVDAQDEELADLLVDLPAVQSDGAGQGDFGGEGGGEGDGGREEVFEQGRLDALGQSVGDGEFGHVVLLFAEGDEVVVDPGLVFAGVVEVEILRLHVVLAQFFGFEFGDFFEEALLLLQCHAPDHHGAIIEKKHFWCVHVSVEVQGRDRGRGGLVHFESRVVGDRGFSIFERGVASGGGEVD